jgi:glycosyltransferase involved in cell wall biosynthesis
MRIVINGWFSEQLTTGSGQYLTALLEWLPRVGGEHEFVVVGAGERESGRAGEWVNRQIANSKSANQQISKTTDPRISESANQRMMNRESQDEPSHTQHATRNTYHASRFTPHVSRISPNLAKLWFEQIAFPHACRRLRADVAFVPYWGSPLWRPCPVVVTVHDLIPLLLPLYRGGPLQRAYTWLVSRTARRADAVLTDSAASKRDIVTHLGIPAERVHAIHLAADPRYRPVTDPVELARVRAKYGLPAEPFLLYLGGFDARKNVVRMIEAYARMVERLTKDEGPKTEGKEPSSLVLGPPSLVIAGQLPTTDTPFAPDPRPVVARLGVADRVHFTGWVDEADKPALYSLALGSVFVSEYEGFGLPVLEGMAANRV